MPSLCECTLRNGSWRCLRFPPLGRPLSKPLRCLLRPCLLHCASQEVEQDWASPPEGQSCAIALDAEQCPGGHCLRRLYFQARHLDAFKGFSTDKVPFPRCLQQKQGDVLCPGTPPRISRGVPGLCSADRCETSLSVCGYFWVTLHASGSLCSKHWLSRDKCVHASLGAAVRI